MCPTMRFDSHGLSLCNVFNRTGLRGLFEPNSVRSEADGSQQSNPNRIGPVLAFLVGSNAPITDNRRPEDVELKPELLRKQVEFLQTLELSRRSPAGSFIHNEIRDGNLQKNKTKSSLHSVEDDCDSDGSDVSCITMPPNSSSIQPTNQGGSSGGPVVPLWAWNSTGVPLFINEHISVHGNPNTFVTKSSNLKKLKFNQCPCAYDTSSSTVRVAGSYIAPMLPVKRPVSPIKDVTFQEAIRHRLFLGELCS